MSRQPINAAKPASSLKPTVRTTSFFLTSLLDYSALFTPLPVKKPRVKAEIISFPGRHPRSHWFLRENGVSRQGIKGYGGGYRLSKVNRTPVDRFLSQPPNGMGLLCQLSPMVGRILGANGKERQEFPTTMEWESQFVV